MIQEDKSATLSCNNDQTLFVPTQTESGEVIYLARKLTPTECASLQGFEKDWCALVPHKDSAEYKMWGNGIYLIMVVMRRTDVKTAPGEDSWRSCFT